MSHFCRAFFYWEFFIPLLYGYDFLASTSDGGVCHSILLLFLPFPLTFGPPLTLFPLTLFPLTLFPLTLFPLTLFHLILIHLNPYHITIYFSSLHFFFYFRLHLPQSETRCLYHHHWNVQRDTHFRLMDHAYHIPFPFSSHLSLSLFHLGFSLAVAAQERSLAFSFRNS